VDAVVASELKANVETAVVPVTEVAAGKMILDVGPASVKDPADIMLRSSSATGGDG
jgi:3-phosphoglycerate kinase